MNQRISKNLGCSAAHEHLRAPVSQPPKRCQSGRLQPLPAATDFSVITGLRVLVLVDEDNLRISMQRHRRKLSYRRLLDRVRSVAGEVVPLAVLTAPPNSTQRERYLQTRGWSTLTVPQETIRTKAGTRKLANADMDICFEAGRAALQWSGDAILIGSGDGDLSIAIARGVKRAHPTKKVYTLSVPGCASRRLRDRRDLFDASLNIGLDLTRPKPALPNASQRFGLPPSRVRVPRIRIHSTFAQQLAKRKFEDESTTIPSPVS
ncbi:MAG: hypothetical protein C5B50_17605 [Verrucomicrobia bacterium]|nr:MAG: hypothetical protein C5B50_17605 [Verrucomicrobiota bacterium]